MLWEDQEAARTEFATKAKEREEQMAEKAAKEATAHVFECESCNRNFGSDRALKQHLDSPAHTSSFACKEAQHHNVRPSIAPVPYNGIPASKIQPVYQAALKLRHSNPEPRRIIEVTRTTLEMRVVSAIIDGALRLLPLNKDPAREAIRLQKIRERAERASQAEQSFVDKVRAHQCNMMDEVQQKQNMRHPTGNEVVRKIKSTPDILFTSPTIIHGIVCHWIEYKDTFGFKQNPFVHRQHLKQLRKYATTLGSGMVVYSVGFQSELLCIEGVTCAREAEVVGWLNSRLSHQRRLSKAN